MDKVIEYLIDDRKLEVVITRKKSNKNTYLRVKEDMKIYVTTNNYTSIKSILKLIDDNQEFIKKNILKIEKRFSKNNDFYYLGKKYDIVYINNKNTILGSEKIFINKEIDLNKWLKKQASIVFQEELSKMYNIFPVKIPFPSLTIRQMKTRWGVCNVKTKRVTLNLELIKKDIKYLDYVIVHELSHLIHANHSQEFWNLVSITIPNYKKLRKELNNYE